MNEPQAPGRYEMLGLLGEGGHASVYRALDRVLGHEVAMKVLLPQYRHDNELFERFATEAQALASLQHENIVRVFDIGTDARWPYFTMQLIEGPTFTEMAESAGGLPPSIVVTMLRPLASALDYLHGEQLVHRDVKSDNVMLGAGGRVLLMDFGIARALGRAGRTMDGATLGTPAAMSPEQIQGREVGPPADVYALGVLAYQLFAGEPPFVGDTAYVLHAHIWERPPDLRRLRPGLPAGMYDAIDAALAKEPEQRPPTAGAFVDALAVAALLADGTWRDDPYIRPPPEDERPRGVTPRQQRPFAGAPVGVLVLLGLFVFAIVLSLAVGVFSVSR